MPNRVPGKAGSQRSAKSSSRNARAAAKAAKMAQSTMREAKQLKPSPDRRVAKAHVGSVTRAPRSVSAVPSVTRPHAGATATEVQLKLPGGTAHITIHANAAVLRAARDWLDVLETMARGPLSLADLREHLSDEPVGQQLTAAEVGELDEAGARQATAALTSAARAEALAWLVNVIATSYDVTSVADRLGVDPTRVRQRLTERTLYGMRGDGRSWRLPRFQFDHAGREIPHLGKVLRVLPPDLHPRAVEGFLTSPKPELVVDGEALTPRDWLLTGGSAKPVVALAGSLDER